MFSIICIRYVGVLLPLLIGILCFAVRGDEVANLQTHNHFPLNWMFISPGSLSADLPSRGALTSALSLDYSAYYFQHRQDHWRWLIDMEAASVILDSTLGLSSHWAVGLELPFIAMQSGFLDIFLENFHGFLNLPNYGREHRPPNSFAFQVEKDGIPWINGHTDGLQLADVTVLLFYQWRDAPDQKGFDGSAALGVKLPTGSTRKGAGSGAVDIGIYLPMQWSAGTWTLFLTPGGAIIGEPDISGVDIAVQNMFSLSGGLSWWQNRTWRWVGRMDYNSSPLATTHIDAIDRGGLQITFGLQHTAKRGTFEMAFSEDLSEAVPDFTVHLGWTWSFSPWGSTLTTRSTR